MALNKLLPATLVLLALAGTASAAGTCNSWMGSTAMTGSTTMAKTLNFWNASRWPTSEMCNWEITCPTGSFFGAVDMMWGGFGATGSELRFTDVTDSANPMVKQEFGRTFGVSSGYTYRGRRFLVPGMNKLRIEYNASTTTPAFFTSTLPPYGFVLKYKCFTSRCPKEFFLPTVTNKATKSGFALPHQPIIPGLQCQFDFSCATTGDRPILNWQYGRDSNNAGGMGVWVNAGSTNYTISAASTSHATYKLVAASSYTVGVTGPSTASSILSVDSKISTYGSSSTDYKFVWATCQAPAETTCLAADVRDGASLTTGFGTIRSQPIVTQSSSSSATRPAYIDTATSCGYTITCPTGATGIFLTWRGYQRNTWTVKATSTSSTALTTFAGSYSSTQNTYYYNHTGTSLHVGLATFSLTSGGGELTYSCWSNTCTAPDAGLTFSGGSVVLNSTVLVPNTVVPQTASQRTFNTDRDGSSTSYDTVTPQSCKYAVTCPTGHYVILNVTGSMVHGDKVSGISGAKSFNWMYSLGATSSQSVDSSAILASNTASWTAVSNPSFYTLSTSSRLRNRAYGYRVEAGCTTLMPGTCPWSTAGTHFSSLATASLGAGVVLSTRLGSYLNGMMPVGVNCSYPVTCPTGSFIHVTQGAGVKQLSSFYGVGPNAPMWKDSTGATIMTDHTADNIVLGTNSATLYYIPSTWNVSSYTYHNMGFWMNVSCTSSATVAPPPTPAPLTAVPFTPYPASSSATCTAWSSKSTTFTGTVGSTNSQLSHMNTFSSSSHSRNERCGWTLQCPAGSMVGITDLDFNVRAGDVIELVDVANGWKNLDVWTTNNPYVTSGTSYYNKQALYHTNKVRVLYNTSVSSTPGSGLRVNFGCYTTKCPADFVKATKHVESVRTGIVLKGVAVAGVDCSWMFSCPSATDVLAAVLDRGTGSVANFTVAGNALSSTWVAPLSTTASVSRVAASSSGYTVTYRTPKMLSGQPNGDTFWDSTSGLAGFNVLVACQPSTDTSCYNLYRNGATLTGQGTINTDIDGTSSTVYSNLGEICKYDVSCNAGSQLSFTGNVGSSISSNPTIQVFSSATNTTAAYTVGYSFSSATTYSHPTTTAVLQYATTSASTRGGYVSFKCANSACKASGQAGMYDTIVALPNTGMKSAIIPQLASGQVFHSDLDGSSTSNRHPSTAAADNCKFGVSCPTGYNVILNVTGYFAVTSSGLKDEVKTTFGGKTYTVTTTRSILGTDSIAPTSLVTSANSLTWTQKAHYATSSTYGYTVSAGCTSFTRGTCPYSDVATKFDSLKTAALGTTVTIDTTSSSAIPAGVKCSWPVACPAGSYIKFTAGSYQSALSTLNPSAPLFTPSAGTPSNFRTTGDTLTGANSGTISWDNADWDVKSSSYNRGFKGTVSCTATAPSTPTPPAPITIGTGGIIIGTGSSSNSSGSTGLFTTTIVACPYSTTTFDLTEGTRHAMQFDFGSVTAARTFTACTFTFKCPSTSTGMTVKASINPNADVADGGVALLLNDTTGLEFVSSYRDSNKVTAKTEFTALMSGRADAADLLISCLTAAKVPAPGSLVNEYQVSTGSYSYSSPVNAYAMGTTGYNNTRSVSVNYLYDKSYTLSTASRRSYSTSTERAYLLSCHNRNMSSVLNVAQLISITGQTGSAGDQLVVYALDSDQNMTFGGENATIDKTWTRSTDRTKFEASTQYYVTWSSDSTSDDSSYNGPVIKFMCGESETGFTVTGAGEAVANSLGNGASAPATLMAAALAALLLFFA